MIHEPFCAAGDLAQSGADASRKEVVGGGVAEVVEDIGQART